MKDYFLIHLLIFYFLKGSSATLLDGIVTLSLSSADSTLSVNRFLTNHTQIQLQILCHQLNTNASKTKTKENFVQTNVKTKFQIKGQIIHTVGCLPLQTDKSATANRLISKDSEDSQTHEKLKNRVEQRTFTMQTIDCDHSGELYFDEYSTVTTSEVVKVRKTNSKQQRKETDENQENKQVRHRRNSNRTKEKTNDRQLSTTTISNKNSDRRLRTWADGHYLIEIYPSYLLGTSNRDFNVDVILSMKNRHGGYLTADEYPALIFYGIMCCIYAFFAILWFTWCAFYWRELLKIQFWIGGVILIGMIEKSAFLVEYDTVNRYGYKIHFAIVTAAILSCLKRTMSRMLVIIVALGYGVVKPRLGPLKQKVCAIGVFYFAAATTEAMLRLSTNNDEINDRVLMSNIPLTLVEIIIYYWIFTALIATTRILRLRKNIVKLNVYRHFTNTLIFAIVASLLFMIWSLKSNFLTTCITGWREFWLEDAFWHILFSLILLAIMFLFRPSNNNQRYAFVPLLDQSDDECDDDREQETPVFDSIKLRKAATMESNRTSKSRKERQSSSNEEANVSSSHAGDPNGADTVEDALTWVEHNIPTTIADRALQVLDSEDEIINTKLERSKIQ